MEILAIIAVLTIIGVLIFSYAPRGSSSGTPPKTAQRPTALTTGLIRVRERPFRPRPMGTQNLFAPTNRARELIRPPTEIFKPFEFQVFKGFGARIDPTAPCYLTGQPTSSCGCEECKEWRARNVN